MSQPHWMDVIYPYVKSIAVYNCPDDPLTAIPTIDGAYEYPPPGRNTAGGAPLHYGSYDMNFGYSTGCDSYTTPCAHAAHNPDGAPLASLQSPSNTVFLCETNDTTPSGTLYWDASYANPVLDTSSEPYKACTSGGYSCITGRHVTNLTNTLWCDGDIKSTQLPYLLKKNSYNVMYHFTVEDDENG